MDEFFKDVDQSKTLKYEIEREVLFKFHFVVKSYCVSILWFTRDSFEGKWYNPNCIFFRRHLQDRWTVYDETHSACFCSLLSNSISKNSCPQQMLTRHDNHYGTPPKMMVHVNYMFRSTFLSLSTSFLLRKSSLFNQMARVLFTQAIRNLVVLIMATMWLCLISDIWSTT